MLSRVRLKRAVARMYVRCYGGNFQVYLKILPFLPIFSNVFEIFVLFFQVCLKKLVFFTAHKPCISTEKQNRITKTWVGR